MKVIINLIKLAIIKNFIHMNNALFLSSFINKLHNNNLIINIDIFAKCIFIFIIISIKLN